MPVVFRDTRADSNGVNKLSLFLFVLFLVCTVAAVIAGILILRCFKRREMIQNKEDDGGLSIIVARANNVEHRSSVPKECGSESSSSSSRSAESLLMVPPNAHISPKAREMV